MNILPLRHGEAVRVTRKKLFYTKNLRHYTEVNV